MLEFKQFGRFRRFAVATGLALAFVAPGCADETGTSTDDVTDIANTDVKKQSIGNCWIYASVGWVESLRLTHSGEALNLSESYVTYWHWYEQLHGGGAGERQLADLDNEDGVYELNTGGWWATAAELMRRYGMVDEGIFIPEEEEAARSARQSSAKSAINTSLKDGVLKDADARRDGAIVRAELDKAWQLTPEMSEVLNTVFGADVSQTLYDNPAIPADSGLRTVQSLKVGHNDAGDELTLADAIGTPSYSYWGPPTRVGPYAWNEDDYPRYSSGRRNFQIRIQDAMHRRLPAIMTWYVDFAALENDNTFKTPPETPGRQGGHMTVVEDYQINNVPGYGTLAAGELVTDPAILEAALSPEAEIEFFRIKNSWGTSLSPDPDQGDELIGYYDLWMTYLNEQIAHKDDDGSSYGLSGVVLPPDTFQSGGGEPEEPVEPVGDCAHDLCDTGEKLDPACDPCVALIGEEDPFCIDNAWDSICVEEVESICLQPCS
ncbi:MAG: hypothetical protein DRI90_16435 [Deltaproteobacteria bacterium]|nr:MAG: hypothetical protein DRI90_16435 [Deltaproteobacteria bacterium]